MTTYDPADSVQQDTRSRPTDMNITVFGATGQVGRRIVDEAIARGHRVTAVTRSGAAPHHHDSVAWTAGDAREPRDVARLSRDQDLVISATSGPRTGGLELAITAEALLEGVAATGSRLMVIGGAGPLIVPDSDGRLVAEDPRFVPKSIRGVANACVAQLDVLRRNSTVDWTYFSPSADMTPGRRTGQFRTGTNELIIDSSGASSISLEDVAVALLDEAEHPQHPKAAFTAGY
jgi:putative NADH-flavin reductase